MSLGDQIAKNLPYLRRYARALTGSQATGDAFVRATLEAALADEDLKASLEGGRVPLYRAFNKVWGSAYMETPDSGSDFSDHEEAASGRLKAITPMNRQALLLTTLEDFSTDQAAEIMEVSEEDIEKLVQEAVDEPLISMQLEDLVTSLGHQICGTAATRTQAQEVVAEKTPGLVLADIQLADGSSGLDAVDDILAIGSVPVSPVTGLNRPIWSPSRSRNRRCARRSARPCSSAPAVRWPDASRLTEISH